MPLFLFKTEPASYSFDDLRREKRTLWTGVSSPAALGHLRRVRKGDEILIYHTGDEKAIVGLAKATANPTEDPDRPGLTDAGDPKFAAVPIAPAKKADRPVTLTAVKADPRFASFPLVTQARLSVMPVPAELGAILRSLAGL